MSKVSIIIPSFSEPYLGKTIRNLLKEADGNIEILVNLDGNKPEKLVRDNKVSYTHHPIPLGMRGGINECLKRATGKFIMKTDAHCAFARGFDEILKRDCQENWLMIPRRYSLDVNQWGKDVSQPVRDYHYFAYPNEASGYIMTCPEWPQRSKKRSDPKFTIDDTMGFQGSCWFAHRDYFMKRVGFLDNRNETYSSVAGDRLEIGLKYWLTDGAVKVNKNTWYAHLFKNRYFYQISQQNRSKKTNHAFRESFRWAAKHWLGNQEPGMKHSFAWLVEKFWPVPGWPKDKNKWYYIEPTMIKSRTSLPAKEKFKIKVLDQKITLKETPLCKLAFKYGTDKCPKIKHHYTPYYYRLFKNKRNSVKTVFEMGIGYYPKISRVDVIFDSRLKRWYYKGASLKMWRDFFPKAKIVGADIRPETMFTDQSIKTYVCDQTKPRAVKKLLKKIGKKIDLFIDDGLGGEKYQLLLAKTVLPLLKKDVTYVIEDVGNPNYLVANLKEYRCQTIKCSSKWRDDQLVIVKNKHGRQKT